MCDQAGRSGDVRDAMMTGGEMIDVNGSTPDRAGNVRSRTGSDIQTIV